MARHAAAITLAVSLAACVQHEGDWSPRAPAVDRRGASIVLVGGVVPGRGATAVARAVDAALRETRDAGHPATVVYLGSARGPCDAWQQPGAAHLATALADHVAAGGSAFSVRGARERTCDHEGPGARPDRAFVVDVQRDGRSGVASVCDSNRGCQLLPPADDTVVRLAVFDVDPSDPDDAPPDVLRRCARLIESVEEQNALLPDSPPVIAVLPIPVESPGVLGQGGRRGGARFALQPTPIREALARGVFEGVLAGGERESVLEDDLTPAIKRSSRRWIAAPTFQLIAGASGDAPGVRPRRAGGISLIPDARSLRDGFIVLELSDQRARARIEDARSGSTASLTWARRRPPHPPETIAPPLAPCPRCDPLRAPADQLPPVHAPRRAPN